MHQRFLSSIVTVIILLGITGQSTKAYSRYQQYNGVNQSSYLKTNTLGNIPNKVILLNDNVQRTSDKYFDANSTLQKNLLIPLVVKQGGSNLELKSFSSVKTLVIIDQGVPEKHIFYKEVKPGIEIVEIFSNENGLSQLERILKKHNNLDSLHIISHAKDGVIQLGNSDVNKETLENRLQTLSVLDNSLKDGADILFYGCDLAKSKKGEEFLEFIARQANVDIAASNNLTGAVEQGGDWNLEISKGAIETSIPFSEEVLASFTSFMVLAAPVITDLDDLTAYTYTEGDGAVNIDQGTALTLTDSDSPSLDGGNLLVYVNNNEVGTEDRLSFNSATVTLPSENSNVIVSGVIIGTLTYLTDEWEMAVDFNVNATPALVQTLMRAITYENTNTDNPNNLSRPISVFVEDGDGGQSAEQNVEFNIIKVNDLPTITNLAGDSFTYTQGDAATNLDQRADAVADDVDNSNYDGGDLNVYFVSGYDDSEDTINVDGTVTLSTLFVGGSVTVDGVVIGVLDRDVGVGLDGAQGGIGKFQVEFNANATDARVQTLIRAITYENINGVSATTGTRTIRFEIDDLIGGTQSDYDVTVTLDSTLPKITDLGGDVLTYVQGDIATNIDQGSDSVVSDVDDDNYDGGDLNVYLVSGYNNTEDTINVDGTVTLTSLVVGGRVEVGGVDIGVLDRNVGLNVDGDGNGKFQVEFNTNATDARVQTLIRAITYENVGGESIGTRIIRFEIDDDNSAPQSDFDVTVNVVASDSNAN